MRKILSRIPRNIYNRKNGKLSKALEAINNGLGSVHLFNDFDRVKEQGSLPYNPYETSIVNWLRELA